MYTEKYPQSRIQNRLKVFYSYQNKQLKETAVSDHTPTFVQNLTLHPTEIWQMWLGPQGPYQVNYAPHNDCQYCSSQTISELGWHELVKTDFKCD